VATKAAKMDPTNRLRNKQNRIEQNMPTEGLVDRNRGSDRAGIGTLSNGSIDFMEKIIIMMPCRACVYYITSRVRTSVFSTVCRPVLKKIEAMEIQF
jgi:hypothetical protein